MTDKSFFDGMNSKSSFWLGLLGGLGVAFAIGFFVLLGQTKGGGGSLANNDSGNPSGAIPTAPAQPGEPSGVAPQVTKADHIDGPENAKVTIIEFSDIQCPFCLRFHPTVQQIRDEYPNDVRWVYKHFPLDSIHPNARSAAEASECLADQLGDAKFFEYLEVLFAQQTSLGNAMYSSEAVKLGANESKFNECLSSGKFKGKVDQDYQAGLAAGVRGTPGSFINGQLVSGAQPYESVKAIVDGFLQ